MPVTAEQMGGVWTSWKEAANEDVVIPGDKDKTALKVGKSGDYGVDSEELKCLGYSELVWRRCNVIQKLEELGH